MSMKSLLQTTKLDSPSKIKTSFGSRLFDTTNILIMLVICVSIIFPLWDMIVTSFSRVQDVSSLSLNLWPPVFVTDSYKFIFRNNEFLHASFISVSRTIIGTAYHIFVVTIAAYCLTRMKMPFRKTITLIFVVTMFFSGGLIPTYINIRNLNLLNKFAVYILPGGFSMFNAIIMRNFFMSVNPSLEESATIDGASAMQVLFRIIIPLSMPVLATVSLWQMVGQWNAWFDNLIYCTSINLLTLQLLLRRIIVDPEFTDKILVIDESMVNTNPETIKAATTVLVTLPILFVYPFLQKYFVKGIMIGAVKG